MITQGDSPTFRFEIRTPTQDPFDLSNYSIGFFIKRSMQDSVSEFVGALDDGISIPHTLEDGVVDVTIPKEVTSGLRLGRPYFWFLQLTNTLDSAKVFTPVRGTLLATLP